MPVLDVAIRFHGSVGVDLNRPGPPATLTIGESTVRIALDTGDSFSYNRDDVMWSPLDDRTVRMEINAERVFFTGDDDLDFSQLANPIPNLKRRLPRLPRFSDAWTDIAASDLYHDEPGPGAGARGRTSNCAHEWRDLRLAGGIVRRVCNTCGDLTIDLTQVHAAVG